MDGAFNHASRRQLRRQLVGPAGLLTLVEGVLASVAGVYMLTQSVIVTLISAATAALLVGVGLALNR